MCTASTSMINQKGKNKVGVSFVTSWGDHSLAVSMDGNAYIWGHDVKYYHFDHFEWGENSLFHDGTKGKSVCLTKAYVLKKILNGSTSFDHTVLLSKDSDTIYTLGSNFSGQCSLTECNENVIKVPLEITMDDINKENGDDWDYIDRVIAG